MTIRINCKIGKISSVDVFMKSLQPIKESKKRKKVQYEGNALCHSKSFKLGRDSSQDMRVINSLSP